MKRRIFSSVLAVIMIFSVTVFAASADSAVDLTGLTASDSTVNFHINEIYSKIDVLEYRSLSEVVAYSNALRSAAENDTAASDIAIEWNGTVYGLEEFCDEIVFPVIPMGSGARSMADAVMDDDTLWPFGTSVKDPSQTVYDSAAYAEVYDLWTHLRDDHKDGFLPVSEFVTEKAQLEAKIRALTAPVALPTFKVASANLTLNDSISVNFKVNKDVYDAYENVYAVITFGDSVITITDPVYHEEDSQRYYFTCPNIGPHRMMDTISITLHGTAYGQEYTNTVDYSIYKYCSNQIKNASAFKTIATDLLNYGAAAQIYANYNTDNLANAGIDQSGASTSLADPVSDLNLNYATIENPTVAWKSASLYLEARVNARLQFETDDLTGITVEFVMDGKVFVVDQFEARADMDGRYYVYFDNILPNQMRTPFTATVYRDGVAVSNTIQYSVQSYVVGKTTAGTALNDMLIAMLKYADACAAYFG